MLKEQATYILDILHISKFNNPRIDINLISPHKVFEQD